MPLALYQPADTALPGPAASEASSALLSALQAAG